MGFRQVNGKPWENWIGKCTVGRKNGGLVILEERFVYRHILRHETEAWVEWVQNLGSSRQRIRRKIIRDLFCLLKFYI